MSVCSGDDNRNPPSPKPGPGPGPGRIGLPIDHAGASTGRTGAVPQAESHVAFDAFLGTLSHELRNPLAPLRSALHLLRNRETGTALPATTNADQLYDLMERQVDRMVMVVDELLDASRIHRGAVELARAPVSLVSVVADAIDAHGRSIDAFGQRVRTRLPDGDIIVHGDRARLTQIVSCLISNAVRYCPPGTRVDIDARADGDWCEVVVRDDGIGIASSDMARIFELFARAERPGAAMAGGLGVGLTLARSLAQLHGGSLEGQSDGIGCGSVFTLRLPCESGPSRRFERPAIG